MAYATRDTRHGITKGENVQGSMQYEPITQSTTECEQIGCANMTITIAENGFWLNVIYVR